MAYCAPLKTKKTMMAGQRDRGGYNSHGHKHPAHLGNTIGDGKQPKPAPVLPAKGLTPMKAKTRP